MCQSSFRRARYLSKALPQGLGRLNAPPRAPAFARTAPRASGGGVARGSLWHRITGRAVGRAKDAGLSCGGVHDFGVRAADAARPRDKRRAPAVGVHNHLNGRVRLLAGISSGFPPQPALDVRRFLGDWASESLLA